MATKWIQPLESARLLVSQQQKCRKNPWNVAAASKITLGSYLVTMTTIFSHLISQHSHTEKLFYFVHLININENRQNTVSNRNVTNIMMANFSCRWVYIINWQQVILCILAVMEKSWKMTKLTKISWKITAYQCTITGITNSELLFCWEGLITAVVRNKV